MIVDQPDSSKGIGGGLIANASGTVKLKTVVLIAPEEIDEAVKISMDWRPAGQ